MIGADSSRGDFNILDGLVLGGNALEGRLEGLGTVTALLRKDQPSDVARQRWLDEPQPGGRTYCFC